MSVAYITQSASSVSFQIFDMVKAFTFTALILPVIHLQKLLSQQLGQRPALPVSDLDFKFPHGYVFEMGIIAVQSTWETARPQ